MEWQVKKGKSMGDKTVERVAAEVQRDGGDKWDKRTEKMILMIVMMMMGLPIHVGCLFVIFVFILIFF